MNTYTFEGRGYCSRTNLPTSLCNCFDFDGPLPDRLRRVPHPSEPGHAEAVDRADRLINPYKYENEETS